MNTNESIAAAEVADSAHAIVRFATQVYLDVLLAQIQEDRLRHAKAGQAPAAGTQRDA